MSSHIDSIPISNFKPFFDSLIVNQSKIVESLKALNATSEKLIDQHKFLNKVTYDTLFTVGFTVIVFIAGYIFNGLIKKRDIRRNRKKLQRYFKRLIDRITEKTCPQMEQVYKDTYLQTNIDTGILTSPPKIITNIFQRVGNINEQELLDSFMSDNEIESASKIINHIEFFAQMPIEIEKYHIYVLRQSNELRLRLQNNSDKYSKILAEYIDFLRLESVTYPGKDDVIRVASQAFKLHINEVVKANKISRFRDEIVKPVQAIIVATKIWNREPKGLELARLGKELLVDFNRIESLTRAFRREYACFYKRMKESKKTLITERKNIKWK